jgi:tetratricopeptide (TPR) repeat protein
MLAMTSGSIGAWALQLRRGGRSPAPGASEAAAGPSSPSVARPESSQADLWAVLDVEPFADLLTGHDPDLKRGAIDALVRAQGYGAVPVLRRLLRDPDSEIRLYASVALGKLEDQIGQALLAARTAAEADPNEPTAWGELARLYVEYASCGFLAPSMARHYLELAHQAYETARRLRPEQGQLALALCRARLQFGDLEVAERYLEVAVWDSLADPHTHLALMELEYRRGGLAQVAQHATDAARLLKGSYPQQDVVDWWAALA